MTALASYLWMVSPQLRARPVADTISAITGNATGTARQIDAYASVLSLDPAGDPDPATWTVRRTLLDVGEDGQFTETDLAAFIARYFEQPALDVEVQPASPDYSRYDLNGDGYTGGAGRREGFDLDRTGSVQFGTPVLDLFDLQVGAERRLISEASANDLDILCYYAYSALFRGSERERERLLANKCVSIGVVVTPATATVEPGGTATFVAEVRGTTDPRVTWELPGGGGTITAAGVFTAGGGDGPFPVRARSVVDVNRFGDATVTIRALSRGKIAFEQDAKVHLLSAAGGAPVNLTGATARDNQPSLSPDGQRVATIRDGQLLTFVNTDGSGVTSTPNQCTGPRWSGDGSRLVCQDTITPRRIRLVSAGGEFSGFVPLPDNMQLQGGKLALSPTGDRVAFGGFINGGSGLDIFIINVDGTGLVNVTNLPPPNSTGAGTRCAEPDWSPDGQALVAVCNVSFGFNSPTAARQRLEVIALNGGGRRLVRDEADPVFFNSPDWSPDGTEIVFVRFDEAGDDIQHVWTVGTDGSGARQLTFGSREVSPSWAQ